MDLVGVKPTTSSVQGKHSKSLSYRPERLQRDLNPRPTAYKAAALPLSYTTNTARRIRTSRFRVQSPTSLTAGRWRYILPIRIARIFIGSKPIVLSIKLWEFMVCGRIELPSSVLQTDVMPTILTDQWSRRDLHPRHPG